MLGNFPLLREIASENKKTFISTGMSTLEEIDKVVDLFKKQHSPRLHKDGYLYVFDNNDYSSVNSEIVKIDLQNNKIINSFMSKNLGFCARLFFS